MFVCYGNICRSPMAEFLMKDYIRESGRENGFYIRSSATSSEELGRPVHRGTQKILSRMGIDCSEKRSRKLIKDDYGDFDYFIGMDDMNIRDIKRIFGGDPENKVHKILDFTPTPRDVADPYWTGDFEQTFADVVTGIYAFFEFLTGKNDAKKI